MRVEDDVALALKAGAAVVANLLDRRGIKQALWEIDDDVRAELTETVGRLALAAVAPAIEAAALERAAVACDALEVHSTSSRNPGIKRKINVGPAVAAIIRALKETT